MKRQTDLQTDKRSLIILLCTFLFACSFPACTEEDFDGNVEGRYSNTTNNSDTEITIGKTTGGYSFYCYFEDSSKETNIRTYEWKGTFTNIPEDIVMSGTTEIGSVKFSSGKVTFKAYTQKKGTYDAYTDDMADLFRSRTTVANDSIPNSQKEK